MPPNEGAATVLHKTLGWFEREKKGLVIATRPLPGVYFGVAVCGRSYNVATRTKWDLVFASGSFFSPKLLVLHTPSRLRMT